MLFAHPGSGDKGTWSWFGSQRVPLEDRGDLFPEGQSRAWDRGDGVSCRVCGVRNQTFSFSVSC